MTILVSRLVDTKSVTKQKEAKNETDVVTYNCSMRVKKDLTPFAAMADRKMRFPVGLEKAGKHVGSSRL